jgi:hypothetical protein
VPAANARHARFASAMWVVVALGISAAIWTGIAVLIESLVK